MARPRKRVCLEDGLRLDLNQLLSGGLKPLLSPGLGSLDMFPWHAETRWSCHRSGEMAKGKIKITKESEDRGSLRIVVGMLDQRLELIAQPRHFGGLQWYFKCPVTEGNCSVLWLPPGADRFCSRQAWGKQVAYSTQFEAPFERAISAREKVKSHLVHDVDFWKGVFPPKPKWMRWLTYERLAEKYRSQERIIDQCLADLVG